MAQVYKVQVNELEKNLTIRALVEFRNQMIENMKDHTMNYAMMSIDTF